MEGARLVHEGKGGAYKIGPASVTYVHHELFPPHKEDVPEFDLDLF